MISKQSKGRTIRAVFYSGMLPQEGITVTQVNTGKHPEIMVLRAINHLRSNKYGATLVEVFDDEDGKLHATVRRKISGELVILYQREVKGKML